MATGRDYVRMSPTGSSPNSYHVINSTSEYNTEASNVRVPMDSVTSTLIMAASIDHVNSRLIYNPI